MDQVGIRSAASVGEIDRTKIVGLGQNHHVSVAEPDSSPVLLDLDVGIHHDVEQVTHADTEHARRLGCGVELLRGHGCILGGTARLSGDQRHRRIRSGRSPDDSLVRPDDRLAPMHIVSLLGSPPEFGWSWADAMATAASVTIVQTNPTVRPRTMEQRHDPESDRTWWELDIADLPATTLTAPVGRAANNRRLAALLRLIEENAGPVDAIHGNFYSSLAPFGKTRQPQLVTEPSTLFLCERWPEMAGGAAFERACRVATQVYSRCDAVLAASNDQRLCLEQIGVPPGRVFDVPNPVDVTAFPWFDRADRTSRMLRLMTACPLEPTNNLAALIDAMAVLAPTHPNITLDIYGNGSLAEDLDRQIRRNHLEKVVQLCGLVDPKHLASAYHQHDLYVCPSKVESFGLPIVEAILTGLPVVATPVGIARDLASDPRIGAAVSLTTGWESIDLATTLGYSLTHPHPIAERDRQVIVDRFSHEAVGNAAVSSVTAGIASSMPIESMVG